MVVVFTDGACKGNPGKGGWGAVIYDGQGNATELKGGDAHTTNNRMEMKAVIEALKAIDVGEPVDLYMDSTYVLSGLTKWMAGWKQAGWRTKSKQSVKNMELWMELDQLQNGREIRFHWVRGHSGNAGNERADKLANEGCLKHMYTT